MSNSGLNKKSAIKDNQKKILFFCEGSPERGFGHVGRCLALATAFKDEHGSDCRFVFRGSETARNKITEAGFAVTEIKATSDFSTYKFSNENAVVLDLLIPLENSFFTKAAAKKILISTIDDPTPNRLKSDLAFYPPVPQVKELNWDNFSGSLYCDWNYIPLRKEFADCTDIIHHHETTSCTELLITAGGSDPAELTIKVLQALSSIKEPYHAKAIIGPMFKNLDKIRGIALELGNKVELLSNIEKMAELMRKSDAAVSSFGMTAYELAACKIPQILLCLTDDHARSASALHETKAAISLGRYDLVTEQELINTLRQIISDKKLRVDMFSNALKLNIGRGSSNIVSVIINRLIQDK